MTARTVVRWTPEARARVLDLYADPAHSGSSIAAVILVEYGLVVSKSAVIGITFRGSVGGVRPPALTYQERLVRHRDQRGVRRAAEREGKPMPARIAKAPKPPRVPKAVPAPRPVAVTRPAAPIRAEILPSLRIPLLDAPAHACRFIADDPKVMTATVCGHPAAHGSPWCAGHRRICTVLTRPVWIPEMRRAA